MFSHNNTWIHIGWTMFGEGEKALEYYLSICPSAKKDHDVYRSEPYVYAQMTASQFSPTPGEGKNSWLTGTGAWSFVAASQSILGVQARLHRLAASTRASRRNGRASPCSGSSAA